MYTNVILGPLFLDILRLRVDFTFTWDNKNNDNDNDNDIDKNNLHLNFLKGTVLGFKKQGVGIRDKGQRILLTFNEVGHNK